MFKQNRNECGVICRAAFWGTLALLVTFFTFPGKVCAKDWGVCVKCHDIVNEEFSETYHGLAWSALGTTYGCSSCHGSAEKHEMSPSRDTIIACGDASAESTKELNSKCYNCHKTNSELAFWEMDAHKNNDVICTSCHTVHSRRSDVKQPTVCFECHRETRSQVIKRSHHPILEGKVTCSDCHNAHGTLSQAMIVAETPNLLCYTCHVDKRGPFVWVHPPAEENCLTCHLPHGSSHDHLFPDRMSIICLDCHDDSSHHAAAYDATSGFGEVNVSNRFVARGCVECHHTMHGSANFRRSFSR